MLPNMWYSCQARFKQNDGLPLGAIMGSPHKGSIIASSREHGVVVI